MVKMTILFFYDQGYFEKIFAHTSKNKQNFQTLKILYYGKSKNLQILLYSIVWENDRKMAKMAFCVPLTSAAVACTSQASRYYRYQFIISVNTRIILQLLHLCLKVAGIWEKQVSSRADEVISFQSLIIAFPELIVEEVLAIGPGFAWAGCE